MSDFRLGIDFGTSSTVAVVRHPDGRTRPLLFDSSPLLPSAVWSDDDGRLQVGREAVRASHRDPGAFEPHPKRRVDDREVLLGTWVHQVPDIFAAVLGRVADEAARTLGGVRPAATLTHPAAWGAARREVLLEAAAEAGLGTPVLVAEPVAAARYYADVLGHAVEPGRCVVVYDLGAGTFDAAVVQRTADGFRELATLGADDIGGLDLDALVLRHAGAPLTLAPGAPADEAERFRASWDEARQTREALSRDVSAIFRHDGAETPLTREEFEAAATPLLERTVALTQSAVRQSRVGEDCIAGWFLVGGATRTPLVATLLHRATGVPPTVLEDPQLVVAEGALWHPEPAPIALPRASRRAERLVRPGSSGLDDPAVEAPSLEDASLEGSRRTAPALDDPRPEPRPVPGPRLRPEPELIAEPEAIPEPTTRRLPRTRPEPPMEEVVHPRRMPVRTPVRVYATFGRPINILAIAVFLIGISALSATASHRIELAAWLAAITCFIGTGTSRRARSTGTWGGGLATLGMLIAVACIPIALNRDHEAAVVLGAKLAGITFDVATGLSDFISTLTS
ncbi:Hsp70 family protein [Dactylosporangium sp. NPDC051541]|uniref:Hsp70 family protein n=1 Tax=Dactylosporangium sp. NPDC051541 TaxID=3363977 RepID=UPI003787D59E